VEESERGAGVHCTQRPIRAGAYEQPTCRPPACGKERTQGLIAQCIDMLQLVDEYSRMMLHALQLLRCSTCTAAFLHKGAPAVQALQGYDLDTRPSPPACCC
jgi:hypothetical protein